MPPEPPPGWGLASTLGVVTPVPDDTELRDAALLDEIHLVGELIVAASASDGPLEPHEIDEVLGVEKAATRTAG